MMSWIADLRREAWENASANSNHSAAVKQRLLSQLDHRTESRSRRHGGLLLLLPR